jgi:ATP diphosphatase
MAADWESLNKAEKNRTSVTEGIPAALPALALAAKLQRKGLAVGLHLDSPEEEVAAVAAAVAQLTRAAGAGDSGARGPGDDATAVADEAAQVGALLFSVVSLARALDVDPEGALRARAAAFRRDVEALG